MLTAQGRPWQSVHLTSYNLSQRLPITRRGATIIPVSQSILQVRYVNCKQPKHYQREACISCFLPRLSTNTPTNRIRTQTLTVSQGADYLAAQRRNRPSSPHLSIYQPQVTWICGATMRNAAIIITIPVYAFGAAYLFAPLFGWHLDTASMVEWFGGLSVGSRTAVKSFFALPFVFHVLHGLRHLIWDTGMMLTNKQVQITGWATIIGSLLGTIGLVMW